MLYCSNDSWDVWVNYSDINRRHTKLPTFRCLGIFGGLFLGPNTSLPGICISGDTCILWDCSFSWTWFWGNEVHLVLQSSYWEIIWGGDQEMLSLQSQWLSRWWFQTCFIFTPYLRKWSNLTNIFQVGWNYQLAKWFKPFLTFWGCLSSLKLTVRNWKRLLGRQAFPFEMAPCWGMLVFI